MVDRHRSPSCAGAIGMIGVRFAASAGRTSRATTRPPIHISTTTPLFRTDWSGDSERPGDPVDRAKRRREQARGVLSVRPGARIVSRGARPDLGVHDLDNGDLHSWRGAISRRG
jgi:hypothetical protein